MSKSSIDFPAPLNEEALARLSPQALLEYLHAHRDGLTSSDANTRLQYYGTNTIDPPRKTPILKFLSFLWGPIAWIIELAAILSAIVHNTEDFVITLALLFFNAVVGFWHEYQAGNTIDQLRKQLALQAKVCRDPGYY